MKKLIASLLCILLMLCSVSAFAFGPETEKEINFSGYTYGDTFRVVRSNTRLFCIDFLYGRHSTRVVADALDDFAERSNFTQNRKLPSCFFARPSLTSRVIGYDVETELWFVYPFSNSIYQPGDDDAIFYAGVYEFHAWDDLPNIYPDLKEKLVTLYGEPYFTGGDLGPVLGAMPIDTSVTQWYYSDVAKYKPEYTVWKSSANGAYAVLSSWFDTNLNEPKLRLAYISDYAEKHFDYMADLGIFGQNTNTIVDYGMQGL